MISTSSVIIFLKQDVIFLEQNIEKIVEKKKCLILQHFLIIIIIIKYFN